MACTHVNPPGYRFCNACGEAIAVQSCLCGFASQPMDLYCGQCGKLLNDVKAGSGEKPVSSPTGKFDLALLISKIPKVEKAEAAAPKGNAHVGQDAIRKLMAAKKQKA